MLNKVKLLFVYAISYIGELMKISRKKVVKIVISPFS